MDVFLKRLHQNQNNHKQIKSTTFPQLLHLLYTADITLLCKLSTTDSTLPHQQYIANSTLQYHVFIFDSTHNHYQLSTVYCVFTNNCLIAKYPN